MGVDHAAEQQAVTRAMNAGRDPGAPELSLSRDQVVEARRLLGWRQPELAAAAGIGRSTLGNFEAGLRLRPPTLAAIMRALAVAGVEVDERGQMTLRPSR